jgi:predicted PurR-regulated permease PerM
MSENFLSNLSNIFSAGANSLTVAYELLEKLFGGIFNIVTSLTLSIYISIDHKNFVKALLRTLPKQNTRQKIGTLIDKIETQLGHWIASQALLSLIVAGMSWIVLTILGVPFTLPLAILVLLLNSIPSIGATAAAIPAVLVAISTGNIIQIIGVPIGYVFIQQIENNYLAPKIMSNAIGLPPIIIILALLIGAELGGILGILMAIPLSGIIHVTIDYWLELKQKE